MKINEREVEIAVLQWWQSIHPHIDSTSLPKKPSQYRAELKRCKSAEMAILTPGFRALWFNLPEKITKSPISKTLECWGTIAVLLAYVKNANDYSIAYAAGLKTDNKEKSVVSELRFAQLQQAKSEEDFLRRARRILNQLNGNVSPIRLMQDTRKWFNEFYQDSLVKSDEKIAIRWAMEYYQAASR